MSSDKEMLRQLIDVASELGGKYAHRWRYADERALGSVLAKARLTLLGTEYDYTGTLTAMDIINARHLAYAEGWRDALGPQASEQAKEDTNRELSMMVSRLVRALEKRDPTSQLAVQARSLVVKHGYPPVILRDATDEETQQENQQ